MKELIPPTMAVYGKTRKKPRVSSDISLFSSDDEFEWNSHSEIGESSDKLMKIISDGSTTISGNGAAELMPSLDISSKKRSPNKMNSSLEDKLTTSPRKFTRLINGLDVSPSPKRKLAKELRKVADDVPKTAVPATPAQTRKPIIKSSPITPQEKDSWANLFDHIEEAPIAPIPSRVETEDEEEIEDTELSIEVNSIYQNIERVKEVEKTEVLISKPKRSPQIKSRIYGEERSFVFREEGEPTREPKSYELVDDGAEDSRSNINDLRTLGQTNAIKDTTEYTLEGLALRRPQSGLVAENGVLIASLIDIVETNGEGVSELVLKRLVGLITRLSKYSEKYARETEFMLWLASMSIFKLAEASGGSALLQGRVDIVRNLGRNPDIPAGISAINVARIQAMTRKPSEVQVAMAGLIGNWEVFEFMSETYDKTTDESYQMAILGFFEQYLESGKYFESLGVLHRLVYEIIGLITSRTIPPETDYNFRVMRLIVLLCTNYSDQPETVQLLYGAKFMALQVVNSALDLAKAGTHTTMVLFILGYLVNYAEHHAKLDMDLEDITNNNQKIKMIEDRADKTADKEADKVQLVHLVGYNAMLVGHIKVQYRLKIDRRLLQQLDDFHRASNPGIQQRIERLKAQMQSISQVYI